jgi:hypothetical protein
MSFVNYGKEEYHMTLAILVFGAALQPGGLIASLVVGDPVSVSPTVILLKKT